MAGSADNDPVILVDADDVQIGTAGKFEGRYASTTGGAGQTLQITFRSGMAFLKELSGEDEFECWMDGEKIYLHKPGGPTDTDIPIDINIDGTLQTPFGEIKKKGN